MTSRHSGMATRRSPYRHATQRRAGDGGFGFVKSLGLKDFEPVLHFGGYHNSSSEQGGSKWLNRRDAMRIDRNWLRNLMGCFRRVCFGGGPVTVTTSGGRGWWCG